MEKKLTEMSDAEIKKEYIKRLKELDENVGFEGFIKAHNKYDEIRRECRARNIIYQDLA